MKYFYKIPSNRNKEDYSVVLLFDDKTFQLSEKSSCTCDHGSSYRFTKENIEKGNWKCVHIKKALEKYKNGDKGELKGGQDVQEEKKGIYPVLQSRGLKPISDKENN